METATAEGSRSSYTSNVSTDADKVERLTDPQLHAYVRFPYACPYREQRRLSQLAQQSGAMITGLTIIIQRPLNAGLICGSRNCAVVLHVAEGVQL